MSGNIQPMTFDVFVASKFGQHLLRTSLKPAQILALTELPNAAAIEKLESGYDLRFTIYFEGFTDEQVMSGEFKQWINERIAETEGLKV